MSNSVSFPNSFEADSSLTQIIDQKRQEIMAANYDDPVILAEYVYQLCWHWADFSLHIINPLIEAIKPPIIIKPELVVDAEGGEEWEFVYDIQDYGHTLSCAKGMYEGKSMAKLYYTIEKIIFLLIERLKSSGTSMETEVEVAFGGHEKAKRKAFESVINLRYNVIVLNVDPGPWGDQYLRNVQCIAERGYGYPSEAPRDNYRHHLGSRGPRLR